MKNLIMSALMIAALFTSCSKDESDYEGYGNIAVNVKSDVNISAVQTRTATAVTGDALNAYTFYVKRTGDTSYAWSGSYSTLTSSNFTAATDYKISAEDCTASDARTANDNYGKKRIYGESETFTVEAGKTSTVTLPCSVANSMVTVTLDSSLSNYFSSYTVKIGDGTGENQRMLEFNANKTTAYFDAGVTLSYDVTATLTTGGSSVTFKNTIALGSTENKTEAAKNYKITIKASSSNGNIGLSMTVDDSISDVTVSDVTIDPYASTTQE